ncbi:MAG: 4-alpha-glucanotransferase, partial [Pseudomonadota bacterium]
MSKLYSLASALGISPRFRDTLGNEHVASEATIRTLVRATGTRIDTEDEISESLQRLSSDPFQGSGIPVATSGVVKLSLDGPFDWQLRLEDGTEREGYTDGKLRLNGLPIGLHELTVTSSEGSWTTPLPSAPKSAPLLGELTTTQRGWGVAAPVYGLEGPCGIGTYAALGRLASGLGSMGASYLLGNPLHALFPTAPSAYSPYSPSHRRFFNIAHIDPTAAPEFQTSETAQALLENAVHASPEADLVDYPASARTQGPILDALFARFDLLPSAHPRRLDFERWRADRGVSLERYALYEALAEQHGAFWSAWPTELKDSSGIELTATLTRAAYKHAWYQWLTETQLADAQQSAKTGGMALGLMLDLAVGVRADGAEAWAEPDNLANGVSIGAPPDDFNPSGQNWALAPLNPRAMRRGGLHAFAETLRASMRYAGALRIDHILGLNRNFWIANDTGEGTYIQFPQQALFAVLAIEAHRNQCIVIGEDLGNVPEGFRNQMDANGLYGCRLLYFQRSESGAFADPKNYAPKTVASIGSHDL